MSQLYQWAAERGWVQQYGSSAFDEGSALHHLLEESFGRRQLKPFRLLVPPGRLVGSLYAYSSEDANVHKDAATTYASPEQMDVLKLEELRSKLMPNSWIVGRKLGFDIRVRPTRRLDREHKNGQSVLQKGSEVDAFLVDALRQHPTNPIGMAESARTREAVYLDWIEERLGSAASLDRNATHLKRFRRELVKRGGSVAEGPDAIIHGTLRVENEELFRSIIAMGIGRHRAYGYGMLLLRPPRP